MLLDHMLSATLARQLNATKAVRFARKNPTDDPVEEPILMDGPNDMNDLSPEKFELKLPGVVDPLDSALHLRILDAVDTCCAAHRASCERFGIRPAEPNLPFAASLYIEPHRGKGFRVNITVSGDRFVFFPLSS